MADNFVGNCPTKKEITQAQDSPEMEVFLGSETSLQAFVVRKRAIKKEVTLINEAFLYGVSR